LNEQARSIKDLVFAIEDTIFFTAGNDSAILPAWVANHSAGFGSSCPLTEQAYYISCRPQVNLDSLNIDDLVSEAVDSEDVVAFVLQVKRRFRNQRGLIREVEELQTK